MREKAVEKKSRTVNESSRHAARGSAHRQARPRPRPPTANGEKLAIAPGRALWFRLRETRRSTRRGQAHCQLTLPRCRGGAREAVCAPSPSRVGLIQRGSKHTTPNGRPFAKPDALRLTRHSQHGLITEGQSLDRGTMP